MSMSCVRGPIASRLLLAANLTAPLQPANDENRIGPRRLYLNLGARGIRDASSSLFESYPDAAHWEHHAFEADANFNAAWAAAAEGADAGFRWV